MNFCRFGNTAQRTSLKTVRCCSNSCDPFSALKDPRLSSLKRGTGGRCSFNGIVATVFGASGFLGRYLCNSLGKSGTLMVLPYRGDVYEMRHLRLCGDLGSVVFMEYHLMDEGSIRRAVKHSNVVINLVGRDWETRNFDFERVHVDGARKIAKVSKECGVDRLVHVSALNCDPHPPEYLLDGGSNFLKSKHSGEEAVREEFQDAIVFRPSDMYGLEDRFLRYFCCSLRRQARWMPLYRNGEEAEKQPVNVANVADGIVAACKAKGSAGKTYQAVGPTRYLLSEIVDWFHRVMDKYHDWGYWRYPLERDPFFRMRINIQQKFTLGRPIGFLDWEKVERECHSDIVCEDLPTLEDLGVQLSCMEEEVPWMLRNYKAHAGYDLVDSEIKIPVPPQPVVTCKETDSDENN